MKENKNLILTGFIYAIIFGVYNVLVFLIVDTKTDVFWLSYGFATLAFIVQIVSMLLSFKTANVETIFFGISLASLSVYYLGAELCVSALFMLFQKAGWTVSLIVQLIMLATFLVVAIVALMARDAVQDVSLNIKEHVHSLKAKLVDVEVLLGQCQDPELKTSLRKLTQTIKYSDPIANASIADIEAVIEQKMSELRIYCESNKIADAKESCLKLELLFLERNKKLAISK